MWSHLPPLIWLRSFESAARNLSFTEAARELNLTQAAVSKHVRSLEEQLRRPLFQRLPRSLQLTEAGIAYLPRVQEVFERLGKSTTEIFGQHRRGAVTLRVSIAFAALWLTPRLPGFLAAYPDVELNFSNSIWSQDMIEHGVDLDVRYGLGNWSGMRVERLTQEELFPVCSPDYPSSRTPLRDPSELDRETLLHVMGYTNSWSDWLLQAGLTHVRAQRNLQFDNSATALALAAAGCGVALGRTSLASELLEQGRLVKPFVFHLPTHEGFFLVSAGASGNSPGATVFRDWLLDESRALRKSS